MIFMVVVLEPHCSAALSQCLFMSQEDRYFCKTRLTIIDFSGLTEAIKEL